MRIVLEPDPWDRFERVNPDQKCDATLEFFQEKNLNGYLSAFNSAVYV